MTDIITKLIASHLERDMPLIFKILKDSDQLNEYLYRKRKTMNIEIHDDYDILKKEVYSQISYNIDEFEDFFVLVD